MGASVPGHRLRDESNARMHESLYHSSVYVLRLHYATVYLSR
jgi:hypothetical protein